MLQGLVELDLEAKIIKNLEDFKAHILDEYPKEAVGLVIEEEFKPLVNVASNPFESFEVEKGTFLIYKNSSPIIIHSHTYKATAKEDPRTPSKLDMILADNTGMEQGIVHCNGYEVSDPLYYNMKEPVNLYNRRYISGVYDCHTIVRDYYIQERAVTLPIMPRSSSWVKDDPLYLLENVTKQGFKQVEKGKEQKGDVLLFSYGTRQPSHLGIYLGEDVFLHHLNNHVSGTSKLSDYPSQHIASYTYEYRN